jgi:hypothetical protein
VPGLISYQGRLADAAGVPLGTAAPVNRVVVFRLWDDATATGAANRLFSEQQTVTVSAGDFNALIGNGTPVAGETSNAFPPLSAATFGGATRWLGITVDDGDGNPANDPEAKPRLRIVATAFALRTQLAETLLPGGIVAGALANDSVASAALGGGAVDTSKFAAASVTTAQLADGSVVTSKIANNAVGAAQLADGAVTTAKLAPGALDAAKLADGAVTATKLAADSVDGAKIADGAIAAADLTAAVVDGSKLADGAVTLAKLAPDSVNSSKLADGSVTNAKLAPGAAVGTKLAAGSVGSTHLNAGARDVFSKGRHVYNQGMDPDYVTKRTRGFFLFPIDLADLGNDADGCRITVIAQHCVTFNDWRTEDFAFYLTQPGFVTDASYPGLIWGRLRGAYENGVGSSNFRLGLTTWNTTGDAGNGNDVTRTPDSWVRFYAYYPGSLRAGTAGNVAPYNQNQHPNPTNAANSGPPITANVSAVVAGLGTLTVTLDNPHAIQVGNTVTIAGMTGAGTPNGTYTVTAVPHRTSFTVAFAAAAGAYTGGTVTYQPTYNKFRLWVAVHPDVSTRVIVADR